MARKTVEIFPDMNFGVVHDIDKKPNIIDFQLHNHDDLYEIVLLLNGDCEFLVEGNSYDFRLHDIIFTRPFELHHIVCLSEKTYERIIIYIRSDYFKEHNCENFLEIFNNRTLGTDNLIPYDISDKALLNCIQRLLTYSEDKEYKVADNIIYEFLYLINKQNNKRARFYAKNERVRNIIMFINDHLSDELNLDTLANEFFIAKHYMCKVFKKNTGYTVNQYITYKRILLAEELHRGGQTLIEAGLNAGFNSYANFYKAYVKLTGTSPRNMS